MDIPSSRLDQGSKKNNLEKDQEKRDSCFFQDEYGGDLNRQNKRVLAEDGDVEKKTGENPDDSTEEAGGDGFLPGFM